MSQLTSVWLVLSILLSTVNSMYKVKGRWVAVFNILKYKEKTGQLTKLFWESNVLPSFPSGTTCFPLQKMELLDCGVFKRLLAWWDIKDTTTQYGTHSFLHMDIILCLGAMIE